MAWVVAATESLARLLSFDAPTHVSAGVQISEFSPTQVNGPKRPREGSDTEGSGPSKGPKPSSVASDTYRDLRGRVDTLVHRVVNATADNHCTLASVEGSAFDAIARRLASGQLVPVVDPNTKRTGESVAYIADSGSYNQTLRSGYITATVANKVASLIKDIDTVGVSQGPCVLFRGLRRWCDLRAGMVVTDLGFSSKTNDLTTAVKYSGDIVGFSSPSAELKAVFLVHYENGTKLLAVNPDEYLTYPGEKLRVVDFGLVYEGASHTSAILAVLVAFEGSAYGETNVPIVKVNPSIEPAIDSVLERCLGAAAYGDSGKNDVSLWVSEGGSVHHGIRHVTIWVQPDHSYDVSIAVNIMKTNKMIPRSEQLAIGCDDLPRNETDLKPVYKTRGLLNNGVVSYVLYLRNYKRLFDAIIAAATAAYPGRITMWNTFELASAKEKGTLNTETMQIPFGHYELVDPDTQETATNPLTLENDSLYEFLRLLCDVNSPLSSVSLVSNPTLKMEREVVFDRRKFLAR